jgi:hypothetical protein
MRGHGPAARITVMLKQTIPLKGLGHLIKGLGAPEFREFGRESLAGAVAGDASGAHMRPETAVCPTDWLSLLYSSAKIEGIIQPAWRHTCAPYRRAPLLGRTGRSVSTGADAVKPMLLKGKNPGQ